jgi:hypothetical protein
MKGVIAMGFIIPRPLKAEHEELHAELTKAAKARGEIGKTAKAVAKILHPHFVKEEEYALPPLGLLSILAKGKFRAQMRDVLNMTNRLQAELPQLLQEHNTIMTALKNLSKAARKEKMRST